MPELNIEKIAKVVHEANKAYCDTIGDTSQKSWEEAPEWQKKSALAGVKFHVETLNLGIRPQPEDSHNSWMKQKVGDGWKYGEVKDEFKKEHPCIVPYNELPLNQRMKDYIFAAIVEAFFRASRG
jgi:hypothetical protein